MSIDPMWFLYAFGLLINGPIVVAICRSIYIARKHKRTPIDPNLSLHEISVQMAKKVQYGEFLMHTLKNNKPQSDDGASLAGYASFIQKPHVISCIQQTTEVNYE